MKKTIRTCLFAISFAIISLNTYGQVAINMTGNSPNSSAMLDIESVNRGILIPRISLTSSDNSNPVSSPATGLLVYNIADNGTGNTAVYEGFYYWTGSSWTKFTNDNDVWNLQGNSGTVNGVNFLGTTDNQDIDIRTNNIIKLRFSVKGQIEFLNSGNSVFIGENAGENDDLSDNRNVFIGFDAGKENTTGIYNNSFGYGSLSSNTTGQFNTANGALSLQKNIAGESNTATGYTSLQNNESGSSNSAFGSLSLMNNTTGNYNTATGYQSLYSNTTGNNNTSSGSLSLRDNTTGTENTASGVQALSLNTEGNYNTATGKSSLYSNTTGDYNTATGIQALTYNETGNENTADGGYSLYSNIGGDYNTAVGYYSLYSNTTGSSNTALGYSAFSTGTNYTNSTSLGYNAEPGASNTIRLGNSSVLTIGGFANWTNVSDKRFKINITENVVGLDFIMKLKPVTYNLDMEAIAKFLNTPDSLRLLQSELLKGKEIQSGFIAQEVEYAANCVSYDFHGIDIPKNDSSYYGLRYAEFVVPIIKAIQEQQLIIEKYKQNTENLNNEIKNLKSEMSKVIQHIENLE